MVSCHCHWEHCHWGSWGSPMIREHWCHWWHWSSYGVIGVLTLALEFSVSEFWCQNSQKEYSDHPSLHPENTTINRTEHNNQQNRTTINQWGCMTTAGEGKTLSSAHRLSSVVHCWPPKKQKQSIQTKTTINQTFGSEPKRSDHHRTKIGSCQPTGTVMRAPSLSSLPCGAFRSEK